MACPLPQSKLVSRVGLQLLAISTLTPIISPEFIWTGAQGPSFWVLFVTLSILSALLHSIEYFKIQDFLFGLLCSLISAALMKCFVPNILLYTAEFTKMPFQMQLVLGVEGQTYKRQWQMFFFVNFGQNGTQCFTVVLHSNVCNGKEKKGLTVR